VIISFINIVGFLCDGQINLGLWVEFGVRVMNLYT
jgi:hypothetical protein